MRPDFGPYCYHLEKLEILNLGMKSAVTKALESDLYSVTVIW